MTVSRPSSSPSQKRVLTVAPMPPEKLAYALARYSRSPDSITESIEWVRTHDSTKFLESFYFQYGHASIADLGHLAVCFEGISEIAATEIEDEQLWDGQGRSSRYQDFAKAGVIVPPEFSAQETHLYSAAAADLLAAYGSVQEIVLRHLEQQLPRPNEMKPEAYQRNLTARAFDVARYLLPFGVPTGVGQVNSIRSLEKQISRFRASEFAELRELGEELSRACAAPPVCGLGEYSAEPVAPTLARHAAPNEYAPRLRADLAAWAKDFLPPSAEPGFTKSVDLLVPADQIADICATLLFTVTARPFRELYEIVLAWPETRRQEILKLALGSRTRHDELPRHFRTAPYVFEFVIDIGAYRDLHRHRRCQQFRQPYTNLLGYETPEALERSGAAVIYANALEKADAAIAQLPHPAAQYLMPFAARSRFLFKMDFAELEYISRLRSGVKGHFSYRKVAWEMKQCLTEVNPALGALIEATPPWIEDPLNR